MAYAPKILSGIDVLDQSWGGLYRGGSYLIYGRAATGRGLMTMMFTQTGAMLAERCLFISPDRPKDLMIQAASMGFNLRKAYESGAVKLMRIPPMLNLQEVGDDGVSKALNDLVSIIRQNRPGRLVINDFMPFVQFRSFERFRASFVQMLEQIDSLDTTLMLVMAEPANQQSRKVIDFMRNQMTGSIHIELVDDDSNSTKRRLTLIPNIGHIKRRVVEYWDLEDVVEVEDDRVSSGLRMLPSTTEVPEPEAFDPYERFEPVRERPRQQMAAEGPFEPHYRRGPAEAETRRFDEPTSPRIQPIPLGRPRRPVHDAPEYAPYSEEPVHDAAPRSASLHETVRWEEAARDDRRREQYVEHSYEEELSYEEPAARYAPPAERFQPEPPRFEPEPRRFQPEVPRYEPEADRRHPETPAYQPEPRHYQPEQPRQAEPELKPAARYAPAEPESYRTAPPRQPEPESYRTAPPRQPAPESYRSAPPRQPEPEPTPTARYAPPPADPVRPAAREAAPRPQAPPEPESYRTPPPRQPEPGPKPTARYAPPPADPVHPAAREAAPRPQAPPEPTHRTFYTQTQPPARPAEPAPHDRSSHTDRDAFRDRLQQHFLRRDVNDTPFLLVAMRMDRSEERSARPFDFEFILDLVTELLRSSDDLFVDLEMERLILLLGDSRPEEAQRFFARLKNRLREEAPQQADHLLHSVSAIVVPDGRPFQNAEEFLTYALDEA